MRSRNNAFVLCAAAIFCVALLTLRSYAFGQTWVLTGNMAESRARHSAVLLCDGRVLVLGSAGHAELYDPFTRTFTPTGDMHTTGYEATATRLLDCRVLVAGGNARTGTGADPGLAAAEIYNPGTGTFTLTGSLSVPRKRHAAVLLQGGPQDGRVLITGGNGTDFEFYATTEIFDPQANGGVGAFISGGTMSRARGGGHTSTRLLDGRVLVAGGSSCPCPTPADPADIYDPATGMWSVTGPTQEGIAVHTATLLGNGKVLIAGGGSGGGPLTLGTAELYDPATNTFTFTTSLNVARKFHAASLLPNGTVLISGGTNDTTRFTSAEIYDPVALTWTLGPPMNVARETHTSTQLLSGDVLVTGGSDAGPTAEVFTNPNLSPTITSFTAMPSSGILPSSSAGVPVTFTVVASNPDGTIVQAQWDFTGDGTVDRVTTALTTSFTYTTAGTFHPSVTVMDNGGATDSAATPVLIETPIQAITDLSTSVQGLPLNTGQKNSLMSKLNTASDAINRGNVNAACNQLSAFINEVNGLVQSQQLAQATASKLINANQAIKTAIGCS